MEGTALFLPEVKGGVGGCPQDDSRILAFCFPPSFVFSPLGLVRNGLLAYLVMRPSTSAWDGWSYVAGELSQGSQRSM